MEENFYKKVLFLVIPMALQNLINVGISATDVLVLGRVGEKALSGCSLGGQVFWILCLFLFGSTSGASVLVAQYWGKKDVRSIEKILSITLMVTETVAIIFMLLTLFFTKQIMHIFSSDPVVVDQGVQYMKIIAFTFPFAAFSMTYLNILKSVEKVIISTIVYAISLVFNAVFDVILVFGYLGFPALGIRGTAIATLCARMLEVVIVILYVRKSSKDIRPSLKDMIFPDKILWKDFIYFAAPVMLNEVLWGGGYSANTAIMGHLGSSAVAANSVAQIARQLSMVIGFGIASATAIVMGKAIGEKKEALAQIYAKKFIKLSLMSGILGAGLILILRIPILYIVDLQGEAAKYLEIFLLVMSYYVIAQALNTTWVVGIFRSGGDTRIGMLVDVSTMWGGSIILGCITAFVFRWPVVVVYIFLMSDEILKIPICIWRYRSKKWLRNVTR